LHETPIAGGELYPRPTIALFLPFTLEEVNMVSSFFREMPPMKGSPPFLKLFGGREPLKAIKILFDVFKGHWEHINQSPGFALISDLDVQHFRP